MDVPVSSDQQNLHQLRADQPGVMYDRDEWQERERERERERIPCCLYNLMMMMMMIYLMIFF